MADDLRERLARVAVKSQMLVERYEALQQRLEQADERIAELEAELARCRNAQRQAQRQIELMHVADTISPTREDLSRSRVMLTEMLREIDKCIELLTY